MAEITAQQVTDERMQEGRELYPAGEYLSVITESDYGLTKSKDMERMSLTIQFLDGPYKGKRYFEGFNLKNLNSGDERKDQSVNISWRQYNSLKDALGVTSPKDTSLLHNIPFILRLGVKNKKDSDEKENIVKGYFPANGKPAQPSNTEESGKEKSLPWERNK